MTLSPRFYPTVFAAFLLLLLVIPLVALSLSLVRSLSSIPFSLSPSPFPLPLSVFSLAQNTVRYSPHRRGRSTNRYAFLAILLELINEYRCRGIFIETGLVRNERLVTIGRRDAPARPSAGRGNYLIGRFEFFAPNFAKVTEPDA